VQSSYGANEIIYCGYRYDPESENYYVRNRYYSPTLGRWLTRDPIGYEGGINLYAYVASSPVGNVDAAGLQVYMYGAEISNTPNGPAPTEVWHDAGALSMWDQFLTGGGGSVVITGKSFLHAVEGSWQLKAEEAQYKKQLLEKVKAAAGKLRPGQSATVKFKVKDFTYTMPGFKLNPFGRYLGFGEIHVNIDGSVNVRKDACGKVKYSGGIFFNGFDRYQWGTLTNAHGAWWDIVPRSVGDLFNLVGTPFDSSWNWIRFIHGEF
jgi:RHS repeat-associated protein